LVALRAYWKNGRVKIELGLGLGKDSSDKRQDLKKKAEKRDVDRELARVQKRK
jgi:SsrA-binding protein